VSFSKHVSPATPSLTADFGESAAEATRTYGQILKSTALVGGASAANVLFGILRTKAMAVLLGPSGVGLMGLYGSIADLTRSLAGLGIPSSGVRQIAEAHSSGDAQQVARTAIVIRRITAGLGLIGAAVIIIFARPLADFTFGNRQHASGVMLLALAVFLQMISAGQAVLIQGLRRISDLARMNVWGGLGGSLAGVLLVYFFRNDGIVPSLIAGAAISLLVSWYYSRRLEIHSVPISVAEMCAEAMPLLRLGLVLMVSGIVMMGSAYAVRLILLNILGFEAAGLYQAAWTVGGLYVEFILQAMGADFYPRLTASANDHEACTDMVNDQARIGVLLAGPGALATLAFAPIVIGAFYSSMFGPAVDVLRWICFGAALRVLTWPMGFIILAKGRRNILFWTELAWGVVNISLTWMCVKAFGLSGAGIAFFGSYIFHGLLVYQIASRLIGFRWSAANLWLGSVFLSSIAMVFWAVNVLPAPWSALFGTVAVGLFSAYSISCLAALLPMGRIPKSLERLIVCCGKGSLSR
jgi:antigen flippase